MFTFDPRLLNNKYPSEGSAFVETGRTIARGRWTTGRKMEGHWITGKAVGVYHVGETPLFMVFVSDHGTEYAIEHSEQFKAVK